jgi:hypothetical protein
MRQYQPTFGNGGSPRGRRITDDTPEAFSDVEKIDRVRARQLSTILNSKGKTAEARRAFQVAQRDARGPQGNRELSAARSINDMESSERQGVHRAGRRRGITTKDTNREFFARSAAGRAGRPNPFGKSRYYDPESRRQRRLGMYEAGLAGLGATGLVLGGRGAVKTTRSMRAGAKFRPELKGKKVVSASGRNLAFLGGGVTGVGGAVAVNRHAESRRGRPMN